MRLIDADSVKRGIEELKRSPWYNEKKLDLIRKEAVEVVEHLCIDKEPTIDAVPVVRCKDCKYCSVDRYAVPDYVCIEMDCGVRADDFCSSGERR